MCGRFTLAADLETYAEELGKLTVTFDPGPRYNIAPTQPVAVVLNAPPPAVVAATWGLIPSWSKDPSVGSRMINARSETLAEKPSFRKPLRAQRCLVLADGFYEWQKPSGQSRKVPYYIHFKSRRPFAFAGLWDRWRRPTGGALLSCTIITTPSNALLSPIHHRMPAILKPEAFAFWLKEQTVTAADALKHLSPYPSDEMEAYPVGTRVNKVTHDGPDCITPARDPDTHGSGRGGVF